MRKTHSIAAALALGCLVQLLSAQETAAPGHPPYYHLNFVVKEIEGGKVVNTRSYSTSISPGSKTMMRIGNKVPYQSGPNSTNYADIGVNIDCSELKEDRADLMLFVDAEVSSLATKEGSSSLTTLLPVIRQNKWRANVIVPVGKATVIFASDDPGTKAQMQLELTASPVK